MSEVFGAKLLGVAAAIFVVLATLWMFYDMRMLGLSEALVGLVSSIVVGALAFAILVKLNYREFPEENNT